MGKSMGGNRNPIGGDMPPMPNSDIGYTGDLPSFLNGKSEMNMRQDHGNRGPKNFDRNMQNFNGNPQRNEASSRYNNANLTLLVVCVGILAVGLVITTVFTRRKKW